MNILRTLLALIFTLALQGCLEGGVGGTGTGPGLEVPTSITGIANKGPFVTGSSVTVNRVGRAGQQTTLHTSDGFGQFTATVLLGRGYQLRATGRYFSEHTGLTTEEPITLSAVMVGESDEHANINLATHLAHLRILNLMDGGISMSAAIPTAESELTLALSSTMPSPSNPIRYSDLLVLNGVQGDDNEEGNGWLLALTSMIERAAITASDLSGRPVEYELADLCDALAADLADDGVIDTARLQRLVDAKPRINPDIIHRHLLEFNSEHRVAAIAAQTGISDTEAMQYHCGAFGSQMVCAMTDSFPHGSRHQVMNQLGGMSGTQPITLDLESVVPNMNRYIDSDDDGLVNRDDDDDDNDGVADSDDDTPYGN